MSLQDDLEVELESAQFAAVRDVGTHPSTDRLAGGAAPGSARSSRRRRGATGAGPGGQRGGPRPLPQLLDRAGHV